MRRIKVLLWAAAAVACLAGAAPAQADFHSRCEGPASALPDLRLDGQDLVYSATVECPGADFIAIDDLTIISNELTGQWLPPQPCFGCSTMTASGRIPAQPGLYRVTFGFRVSNDGFGTAQSTRSSRWLFTGVEQPRLLCRRDAVPNRFGC